MREGPLRARQGAVILGQPASPGGERGGGGGFTAVVLIKRPGYAAP